MHLCNDYRTVGRFVFRINLPTIRLRSNPLGLLPYKFCLRSISRRRNRSVLLSGKCGKCVNRRRSAKRRLPPLSDLTARSARSLPNSDVDADAPGSILSVVLIIFIFPPSTNRRVKSRCLQSWLRDTELQEKDDVHERDVGRDFNPKSRTRPNRTGRIQSDVSVWKISSQ